MKGSHPGLDELQLWRVAESACNRKSLHEKPGIAAESRGLAPKADGAGAAGAQAHPSTAAASTTTARTAQATVT
jgi:hypothetical protein